MSDTNTKLHDDLMGLREAAQYALSKLEECEGLGVQGVTDAANVLYVALHPDSDNDEMQERVYAALATAPESDHREIARLKGEIELLALAVNLKIGLSRKLYHVECSHCGTRYSDASSRFPICPNCHQVARVWLRDEAEIDPEGSV